MMRCLALTGSLELPDWYWLFEMLKMLELFKLSTVSSLHFVLLALSELLVWRS